jgi:hypothetical protein
MRQRHGVSSTKRTGELRTLVEPRSEVAPVTTRSEQDWLEVGTDRPAA